jgi:hypothetical protein
MPTAQDLQNEFPYLDQASLQVHFEFSIGQWCRVVIFSNLSDLQWCPFHCKFDLHVSWCVLSNCGVPFFYLWFNCR